MRATVSRVSLLKIALAAGSTLAAPSVVLAQTPAAPASEDADIVVTGFRASLESALNAKRLDTGIVDVIKAEDIAKFPDTNLAESLQRVPGVVIDRDAGEGRNITVRGLGGDFTRVRINGIEALATTGGTDSSGGANRSRGFDFNVFASELFRSITVRKSSSANVEEGSLGATVDLQTSRPFDFKKFTVAASVQGRYNDLARNVDPRAAFLITDTFADGTFGFLLSAAYSKRRILEEGFSTVRWDDGASSGGFCSPAGYDINTSPTSPGIDTNPATTATNCGAATGFGPGPVRLPSTATNIANYTLASVPSVNGVGGNFHPRLPRYGRLTHNQDRLGITGSLQWRPTDGGLISLDILYSKLSATRQEDFLEAISFSRSAAQGGNPQTSVVDTAYASNGALLFGTYNGVDIRSEQRFDKLSTEFFQPSLTIEQQLGAFKITGHVGYADSKFRNPIQTTTTLDALNVNGYTIDFRNNSRLPAITYGFDVTTTTPTTLSLVSVPQVTSGTQPTTVANTSTSEIRIRPQGADNVNDVASLDLEWEVVPDHLKLFVGGDYKRFSFSTYEFRRVNQSDTIFAPPAGTSIASLTSVLTDFGRGLNIPAGTPTSWVTPNLAAIAAAYDIYCNCIKSGPAGGPGDFTLSSITNGNARGNNRSVIEEDKGGYIMADFKFDAFGMPIRGNVGIRYVKTRQDASGYLATGGGTLVTVRQDYDDWLPSFNLSANVTDKFIVRLAGAKVMARPQLLNLTPGGSINTTGQLTVTTGNPLLRPFRADTLDASFEWYFQPRGFIGVGLFYKKIGTYIQTLRNIIPYNQTGLPLSLLPSNFNGTELFQVTTPINTSGGNLKGFEINYQQPFTFLPGFLKNFGTILNYSRVESKIQYALSPTSTAVITDDLINLSPTSWNGTLYYEDEKFSARGSVSYRQAYLQRVPGQNNNDVEGKNSTLNVDASMSYKLTKNIEVTLEGVNLTDEVNDQFISRARNSPVVYNHTGREFLAGVRVKF